MARYGMAIDLNRCFGCQTCAAACKVANNLPVELVYNRVLVNEGTTSIDCAVGTYPNELKMDFRPYGCQHCDNPACVAVCPTGASQKREDGIVWVDTEICIGCDACIAACPFEGVRTHLSNEPGYYLDVVMGEFDAPKHIGGTVEKCNFCYNLVDRGEVPACMQLCPGRARYWGDLDDPESDVSKAIEGREYEKLHEEAGTGPNIFYLL